MNECFQKKKAKLTESQIISFSELQSFFVKYRRTYLIEATSAKKNAALWT